MLPWNHRILASRRQLLSEIMYTNKLYDHPPPQEDKTGERLLAFTLQVTVSSRLKYPESRKGFHLRAPNTWYGTIMEAANTNERLPHLFWAYSGLAAPKVLPSLLQCPLRSVSISEQAILVLQCGETAPSRSFPMIKGTEQPPLASRLQTLSFLLVTPQRIK